MVLHQDAPVSSHGRNIPLMPAMLIIGNGLSSTSSVVTCGASVVAMPTASQSM